MSRFIVFVIVMGIITGMAYFYIGVKFYQRSEFVRNHLLVFLILMIFFWLLTPSGVGVSLFRSDRMGQILGTLAYINFGFFSILLFLTVLSDLIKLMYNFIEPGIESHFPENYISRKEAILNLVQPAILGTSALVSLYSFVEAKYRLKLEKVVIKFPDLPKDLDGFRILQISDIHIGPTIKKDFLEMVVGMVNSRNPDMIAITGDLVDGSVSNLREHTQPIEKLKSKYGTFFVTGNHEYYSGVLDWVRELKSLGVRVLLNESEIIESGKSRLLVGGVTDYSTRGINGAHASNPFACMEGNESCDFKLLLAHQPRSIFEASKAGFDLQISGHTHGGQYFPGNLLIYLFQPYVAGLYRHESSMVYVNRGTGYWGPPFRTGNRPEITELVLKTGSGKS